MLKMSKPQMDAFGIAAQEDFLRRLLLFVSEELADSVADWSEEEKREKVGRYTVAAMRHGIETEQGMAMFVSLSVSLGQSIDEVPEIRDYLTRPSSIPAEDRLERLVDMLP